MIQKRINIKFTHARCCSRHQGGNGILKIAPKTVSSALCCDRGSFFRLPVLMRYIRQYSQGPLTASRRGEATKQMMCGSEVQETSVHVHNIKSESRLRAEQYRYEKEHKSDRKKQVSIPIFPLASTSRVYRTCL